MSARYGRNKRRAAREALAAAEARAAQAEAKASVLQSRVASAMEDGMARILNDEGRISAAMGAITRELSRALPSELLPHAQKLLTAGVRRPSSPLSFQAHVPMDATFETLDVQGRIDLRFAVRVALW